jgi:hypothetical protein
MQVGSYLVGFCRNCYEHSGFVSGWASKSVGCLVTSPACWPPVDLSGRVQVLLSVCMSLQWRLLPWNACKRTTRMCLQLIRLHKSVAFFEDRGIPSTRCSSVCHTMAIAAVTGYAILCGRLQVAKRRQWNWLQPQTLAGISEDIALLVIYLCSFSSD